MTSIIYDSELMTNYVSAVPVPAGSQFFTVLDPVTSRPVIFALSNDTVPRLQATKDDKNGQRQLIDIGRILGITDDTRIQTFEVKQLDDKSIVLCVAVRINDTTSKLLLCRPFQMTSPPQISTLPAQNLSQISKIFIGPTTSSSTYPAVFVAHQPIDRIAKGSDISRVIVDLGGNTWRTSRDMALPENATGILDIAAASSAYGQGLYILYRIQGQTQLVSQFVRNDPDDPSILRWYTVSLGIPANSTCLETISVAGRTALLVGGPQGVRYWSSRDSTVKGSAGSSVTSSPIFQAIQTMTVSQNDTRVCIWAVNGKSQLCYLNATTDSVTGTPIILTQQTSSFAAATALTDVDGSPGVRHILVSADNNGNLTSLEMSHKTGIWRTEPFYVANATRNVSVKSYTITIQAIDNRGGPVADGSILLQSSSSVPAIINGKALMISDTASWQRLDAHGEIALIIATSGLAGQTLTALAIKDSKSAPVTFTQTIVDPTKKTMSAFSNIRTSDDLKRATNKSGKLLLPAGLSDTDVNNAAKSIAAASDALATLPKDGSLQTIPTARTALATDIGDAFMDGFHWVKQQVDAATDWSVEKVGQVWQFICKIGGEIKKFVLNCLEKVGEALSWVLEKIKIGWDKLVEFCGFIFSWGDILDTRKTISAFITAGLGYAVTKVNQSEATVNTFFDNIKGTISKREAQPSKKIDSKDPQPTSTSSKAQSSTSFKWTAERMKNGGMGSGTNPTSSTALSKTGSNEWSTIFQPVLDSLSNSTSTIGTDIANIFNGDKSMTTGQLFEKLGQDFLTGAIDGVQKLTIALMKLLQKLLTELSALGNKPINIPIFSALYKDLTGSDLTIFDAISLLIAIPTTIFIKLITGKAPPAFPYIDSKLLGRILEDDPTLDRSVKVNFATLSAGILVSITIIKAVIGLIRIIYAAVQEGTAGVVEFLTPGKAIKLLGLSIEIIGVVHSLPTDSSVPGFEIRKWIGYLTIFKASTKALTTITSIGGDKAEKAVLVAEILVALVNFGMYEAVYFKEGQATVQTWSEKDDAKTIMNITNNTLNTIAGVGWFTTMMFKISQPEVAAVGAVVFEVGAVGLAVMEGVTFGYAFDKSQKALLPAANF